MNYDYSKTILFLMKYRKKTKKEVYEHLSLTPMGFDYKVKNNKWFANEIAAVSRLLNFPLDVFFTEDIEKFDLTNFPNNYEYTSTPMKVEEPAANYNTATRLEKKIDEWFTNQIRVKDEQITQLHGQINFLQNLVSQNFNLGKFDVSICTTGVPRQTHEFYHV